MNVDRLSNPATKTFIKAVPQAFVENKSGMEPIGTKVLVLTDWIDEKTASGLVNLPPDFVERMTLAITTGVVAAIGGGAFTDWPHSPIGWPGLIPKVGSRVHIAKYAGIMVEGKDGKNYRLCQDVDICGVEV